MITKDNLHKIAVKVNGGSGLLIKLKEKSFVLTAQHCLLADKNSVKSYDEKRTYNVKKIYSDKEKDIALIELDSAETDLLVKGTRDVSIANEITAYGFPSNFDSTGLPLDGKVNITHDGLSIETKLPFIGSNVDDIRAIENIKGWSGSGVFRVVGNELFLIGILSKLPNDNHQYQVIHCVSLEVILEFMKSENLGRFEVLDRVEDGKEDEITSSKLKLQKLIDQWENAKVDFKREWYWNDNMPKNIKETHKNELVKDLIALTNGDVYSTDKRAYLIIGIDDNTKEVYDFDKSTIFPLDKLKQQLLTLLNNYAQPEFLALDIELVDDVLVISVPPRGSLISLSKDLKLKNKNTDRKGTTYYRVGEDISVASSEVIKDFEKAFGKENDKKGVSITINGDVKGVVNAESGSVIHQTIS